MLEEAAVSTGTTDAGAPPAAEPAAPPAAEPSASAPPPAKPGSPRLEARAGIRDLAAKRAEEAAKAKEPAAAPDPAKPATEPAAPPPTAEPEKPAGEPAEPAAPEGAAAPKTTEPPAKPGLQVAIDTSHPIRHMGLEAITVATPQDERVVRALLNGTYERRQKVDELERKNAELQEQIVRIEARDTAREKLKTDPGFQKARQTYDDIVSQYGQDAADRFWAGVEAQYGKVEQDEYSTRMATIEAQQTAQAAQAWATEANDRARNILPPFIVELPAFPKLFDSALRSFDAEITLGQIALKKGDTEAMHREFFTFLKGRLSRDPAVAAVLNQRKKDINDKAAAREAAARKLEQDRIARDAVEQSNKDAAARRSAAPPIPLPAGSSRGVPQQPAATETLPAAASPTDIRKSARSGAMDAARRHYPR